jgi:hypothetical protein
MLLRVALVLFRLPLHRREPLHLLQPNLQLTLLLDLVQKQLRMHRPHFGPLRKPGARRLCELGIAAQFLYFTLLGIDRKPPLLLGVLLALQTGLAVVAVARNRVRPPRNKSGRLQMPPPLILLFLVEGAVALDRPRAVLQKPELRGREH